MMAYGSRSYYGTWGDGGSHSLGSEPPAESALPILIDRQLMRLEDEERSLKGGVRVLENAMEDLDASVRAVAARVYGGEDMGLDAWEVDEIQRLRALILVQYDEQRELSRQRLRALDRERDALYDQRHRAYRQEHR